MNKIFPINAFQDNYIWTIYNPENRCSLIVDPGDARPVISALQQQHLTLIGILITHHHWDHTNGVAELKNLFDVPVYGPSNKTISTITHRLVETDNILIKELNMYFTILEIPGHTRDHIAYYVHDILFCGDTLFTGGCGKLFEGTAQEMYRSLTKLTQLPDTTQIYCAHEYTLNNLLFAEIVEPDNKAIQARIEQVRELRQQNLPTIPATLAIEKQTNPFLRCNQPTIKHQAENYAKKPLNDANEVFAIIREWKNHCKLS